MKREWTIFSGILAVFLLAYFLQVTDPKIQAAVIEVFKMLQWYARNHTLACVVPAMFIAGGIATFLYSGPAINIMAIFLTARVLGIKLGLARVVGAVVFSVVVGLLMAVIFRKDEEVRTAATMKLPDPPPSRRALWQTVLYLASMIGFLIFSDWANPSNTLVHPAKGAVARMADGSTVSFSPDRSLEVAVLQETRRDYLVQMEESAGGLAGKTAVRYD